MSGIKNLNFSFDMKKAPDDDGIIEGYASTFENVDNHLDVISPGAFRKSLGSGRKVRMLWQHDMDSPIGVWDEIREDDRGLYVRGRISKEVQKGVEAMALFRMGAMDSLSIGYKAIQAESEGSGRIRRLMEVELWEISLVTIPANEAALASVKAIETERDFEGFLRDAGYSRKEATAIALHGFKGLSGLRDAVPDGEVNEGLKSLMAQIRQLQEKLNV